MRAGLWLAALAVWLQVLAGAVMPGLALAAAASETPICHDGGTVGGHGPAPQAPAHDCLACPICTALATIHAVPVPQAPVLDLPRLATRSAPIWHAPTVRQAAWRIAARPRGPPSSTLAG